MALIEENDAQSALTQLRAYMAQRQLPVNSRLPTERELCQALGVTRTAVRKALDTGQLGGDEKLKVSARIQIERIVLDHRVEGEIALS